MIFVLLPFAFCCFFPPGSRLRSRCFPYAVHHAMVHCCCATATEHIADPFRGLHGHEGAACYLGYVDDPCSYSHLAATSGTEFTPNRLMQHSVVTERFPCSTR